MTNAASLAGRSAPDPLEAAALLLDLDGTILDTAGDLATAVNRTLAELGREKVAEDRVRTWIGDGVRILVRQALEATGGCDDGALDNAHERFMVHYGDCVADRSHPFPGVVATLARFRDVGLPMGVVTNKAAVFTEPLLEATGLMPYLDVVVSGDTVAAKKPDPAPVRAAAEALGVDPARMVLVGDSRNDVRAGLDAGCAVVCVTYGYNRGEDVRTLGATRVVETFSQLWDAIRPVPPAADRA